ncbi:hypothetical protein V2W45_899844 [Cenococcum geophilum]
MAVAAFDGRVLLCSLLANFVDLFAPRPQRWLYRYQINAEGCVMVCRDRCGHWQMCFDAFVMGFPKTSFSLFVVFFHSCNVATPVGTFNLTETTLVKPFQPT